MKSMNFKAKHKTLDLSKPVLMGVLNVTPDSFSDGGKFLNVPHAVNHAMQMISDGASIIDVGGESTRPGALPVSSAEEKKRVVPVIEALVVELAKQRKGALSGVLISIDTYKSDVAAAALDAGAHIVNDVTGFTDSKMRAVVGRFRAGAIVMHMQGTPQTMQENPVYSDVVAEVKAFLEKQAALIKKSGASDVLVDPGIGFGKTLEHNLALLGRLDEFAALGYPLCVGVSRKSFIGKLTDDDRLAPDRQDRPLAAQNRLEGTLAAVAACVLNGASVLRVHDVAECKKAVEVAWAMKNKGKTSDEIRVQGIVVKAKVGILPQEKKMAQPLIVNVVAFLDFGEAAASHDVKDTIDYRRIVQSVEKTVSGRHWPLLEGLAERLAQDVKALGAERVSVQIIKPESLPNGVPSVSIER